MPTPYEVLDVAPTATDQQIRQAYRRAALRCHPDKVPPEQQAEATVRFQELAGAYHQIKDASSRSEFVGEEDHTKERDWLRKKASEDRADRFDGSPLQHAYDIFDSAFTWQSTRSQVVRQLMPLMLHRRDYGPEGKLLMDGVSALRHREKKKSLLGYMAFEEFRAKGEIRKLSASRSPKAPVRVVCIRHGMGQHQEVAAVASIISRDASLTDTGVQEAARAGALMQEAGLFQQRLLVVISPMQRTLQTAICVLGSTQWDLPTLIDPMAGEIKPIVKIKDSFARHAAQKLGGGKVGPNCSYAVTNFYLSQDLGGHSARRPWLHSARAKCVISC
jgi:hypothetical protein